MARAKLEIDTGGESPIRRWKSIKLDGHEILWFVRGITIRAHVDEVTTAVIELLVTPEFHSELIAPIGKVEQEEE